MIDRLPRFSDSLYIRQDIRDALAELEGEGQLDRKVEVELVDNELAKVYMNSKRAQTDFGELPLRLREAISVARRMQDPLPEFCQMCTPDEEILCLGYHPLQDQVSVCYLEELPGRDRNLNK